MPPAVTGEVAEAGAPRFVGRSLPRREDHRSLTGGARGVADVVLPRLAHMAFVRSPHAHARIVSVDGDKARQLAGVAGVWSADDLPDLPPLLSGAGPTRHALARDKVRFAGEPVAVVVADDPYVLADACELVTVDYDPLPAATDPDAALAAGAPLLFEELGSNQLYAVPATPGPAMDAAPRRASLRLVNQRTAAAPLEVLGCVADWRDDGLTLWATTQTPHVLRNHLADLLRLPQGRLRVIAPDVGGGFGAKNAVYPEYLLAPVLSRLLARPVRSTQSRSESLVHMNHGRDQIHEVEVGFDDHGRILALSVVLTQNLGAYTDAIGMTLVGTAMLMGVGCYAVPSYQAGIRLVLSNTPPVSAYRGAGRPEAGYTIERVVDRVAAATGIDPAEVRRRNFVAPAAFPYTTPSGLVYDSGDYGAALDRLLSAVDYPALRAEQRRRRAQGGPRWLGIGLATFTDMGGVGPSAQMAQLYLGGWESARVRVCPDGSVVVATGTSPHGQGTETAFVQVAADLLGLDPRRITIVHGDTAATPDGIGTFGSRGVAVGGEALARACRAVVARARGIAAHLLRTEPGTLVLRDGGFGPARGAGRTVSWERVAHAAYVPADLPPGSGPGIEATVYYEPERYTCSFGAHCCIVEVDEQDGSTRIVRYVAVDDAGRLVNPQGAEGQVHGGLAQGIGQALLEHVSYDAAGQPRATTLADYLVPGAADLPPFETEFTVTPTDVNSLGAKGIGESGAVGAPPAVINAVLDALAPLGVTALDMPATPERVWRAIRQARG